MRKIVVTIIILVLIGGGVWYWQKEKTENIPVNTNTLTYNNTKVGISFDYPKEISVKTVGSEVNLHHEVPFVHHDYCDFKGEIDTTINTLTDFNVTMHVVNKSLVETMRTESPYIPEENFVNGNVVVSPGFIDAYDTGKIKGYSIFEGAEGCGHVIYYLEAGAKETLVVVNDFITVFSGAIDTENQSKAEAVPGVLNKAKANAIFDSIMKSLQVN